MECSFEDEAGSTRATERIFGGALNFQKRFFVIE
jgi:hypothetical protein